jgi:ABC-type sugar transport system substrate-binding protein
MKKRLLAGLLAALLVLVLFGCNEENASETAGTPTDTTAQGTDSPGDIEGEELTFVYLCSSLTVQWCQDIADSLKTVAEGYNVKIIASDSGQDNDKYVTQVETYCEQKVDGFILNTSEDITIRVDDVIKEAGIPYLFESTAPYSEDGELLTAGCELNAEQCGAGCGTWLAENYENTLGEITDWSKVGFVPILMSTRISFQRRANGAVDAWLEAMPNCTYEDNVFVADLVKQGTSSADSAFAEVSAILAGNPQIEHWMMVGVLDDYAMGAARAVESMKLEDKTLIASVGGTVLVVEWDKGYEGCWVMCNSYQAIEYSEVLVPALIDIIDGKITVEELWPEWIEEGQTVASWQLSGTPATRDNYRVVRRGYPESENQGITGLENV